MNPVEARRVDARQGRSWPRSPAAGVGDGRRPATSSACSSAAGASIGSLFPEIGLPNVAGRAAAARRAGPARHPAVEPRPRHRRAHRGAGAQHHKTRLNDPHLWFLGTNDQPGDYRSLGLHRAATSSTPTTATRRTPARTRSYGHDGPQRRRAIRRSRRTSGPSDRARVHARDPVAPVHDLPHAPAEHVREHASSATRCGTTRPTRRCMWPEKQQLPDATSEIARDHSTAIPEEAAIARQVGRPGVPRRTSRSSTRS